MKFDAAEVEPVGDPAGDDVHQQPGEAVLGPLGQAVVQPLLELGSVVAEQCGSADRTV